MSVNLWFGSDPYYKPNGGVCVRKDKYCEYRGCDSKTKLRSAGKAFWKYAEAKLETKKLKLKLHCMDDCPPPSVKMAFERTTGRSVNM